MPGAAHRPAGKHLSESGIIQRQQIGQRRHLAGAMKFRLGGAFGIFVPGADGKAVVTAENPVADGGPERSRDLTLVLDRQIGDAAPRIELIGRRKGIRRAGIEAFRAGPAMIGLGAVGCQLGTCQDGAQKQPGAVLARDKIGVLALPARPGLCGQRLFHQRGGVDKHLHIRAAFRRELPGKLFQPALDHIVIVAPARIDRHIAPVARRQILHRVVVRAVIHRQHDGASGLRPHGLRTGAARRGFRQPRHVTLPAVRHKIIQARAGLRWQCGVSDMNTGKTGLGGGILQPAAEPVAITRHQPTGSMSPSACFA